MTGEISRGEYDEFISDPGNVTEAISKIMADAAWIEEIDPEYHGPTISLHEFLAERDNKDIKE